MLDSTQGPKLVITTILLLFMCSWSLLPRLHPIRLLLLTYLSITRIGFTLFPERSLEETVATCISALYPIARFPAFSWPCVSCFSLPFWAGQIEDHTTFASSSISNYLFGSTAFRSLPLQEFSSTF